MILNLNLIWKILNKKEKIHFSFLIFLMLLNSLAEICGIAAIIPLISIIVENDLTLLNNLNSKSCPD